MCFSFLASLLAFLLDLVAITWRFDREKDLELLLLRQHVRILQRTQTRRLRISAWEKLARTVMAATFRNLTARTGMRLDPVLVLFKPATVLTWHRDLVRRKWTFKRRRGGGRPPVPTHLEAVILRFARENPSWGMGNSRASCSSSTTLLRSRPFGLS